MWIKIQDTPPFYLQLTQTDIYEISITDYITLYSVDLSEDQFLSVLKNSNPKLVTTNQNLIDNGTNMLQHMEKLEDISINKDDSYLNINIKCKMFVYPFRLKLKLQEATKENFFKKITRPLLKKVNELQSIEQNLRALVKEKDEEISLYKMNGGRIQKYERTPVFNEEEHLKKHEVYQSNDVPQELPVCLLEKQEVKENMCAVKQEKTNTQEQSIKEEVTTLEQPSTVHTLPETKIKQEIKSEPGTPIKKRRKNLNL